MKGQTDPDRWLFVFWYFQNVSWFFEECASWQGALSIYVKNPEISVGTKMDFPTGKKLFPERRRARYPMGHQDGCRVGNNWNWYKVQETGKWNTKFRVQGKRAYLFRFSTFPGIFQWDEPNNRFPFSIEPKFPKILTKWKAPKVYADFPKKK